MAERSPLTDKLSNAAIHMLIRIAMLLPYKPRIEVFGWLVARLVAPLAGLNRRVRDNLNLVMPELGSAEVNDLCTRVTNNMGRTLIETYSFEPFAELCAKLPLTGPGWEAFDEAQKAGRPVIAFTGHFGNYGAGRMAIQSRGHTIGVLFRPFNNEFFEASHRGVQDRFGPAYPRGKAGMADMVRHLKKGGCIAIVGDQYVMDGEPLTFFGREAATATSAARLALKYDALLIPIYSVRKDDGITFDIIIEPPIPHTDPVEMTQKLNDSLEALIRRYPGQWMWTHRRWKPRPPTHVPSPTPKPAS